MCEFLSFIEKDKKILFLTHHLLFETPQGDMVRSKCGKDDLIGHGAIRLFYELEQDQGKNREITGFCSPEEFPKAIVKAIKRGEFKGLVPIPKGLLRAHLDDGYEAKRAPLLADHEAKRTHLDDDYQAKLASLYADYEAKCAPLYADYLDDDYQAKWASLDTDYHAKLASLYDDYEAKCASLYADYEAKRAPLDAEQWDLFSISENRIPAWR